MTMVDKKFFISKWFLAIIAIPKKVLIAKQVVEFLEENKIENAVHSYAAGKD